ncbi:MAG: leucine-rich repeat domain-containing protein, partial [Acutalibacteraceae bacterium]
VSNGYEYADNTVKSVIIEDGVTHIGKYAFSDFKSMTDIKITDDVESVGARALEGSAWYNNQSDGVIYINSVAYSYKGDKEEKTEIEIREGTTQIAYGAFSCFHGLTSITFPDSLKVIGAWAFDRCINLTKITIPDSVCYIGAVAFQCCSNLESVTLSESMTSISDTAFGSCESLTSIIIPDNIINIGSCAFNNCNNIKDVYYTGTGEQWQEISIDEFNDCLTNAKIHYNYVPCVHSHITEYAQKDATCTENGYTEGVYCEDCGRWISGHELIRKYHTDENEDGICDICGKGIKMIVDSGFCGANGDNVLWDLYEDGELVIGGSGDMADFKWKNEFYPNVPYAAYKVDKDENGYDERVKAVVIEDGVTSIGRYAFYGFESLASVTIAESVTSIGISAFSGCDSLTSVTIPDSVTSIGSWAFYNCSSLTGITIPDSVTSIGDYAFGDCNSLKEINVSDENTAYSSENGVLFNKAKTVLIQYPEEKEETEYTIPDNVRSIGYEAFSSCNRLTNVIISDGVTTINDYAFSNCSNLVNVKLSNTLTYLGENAFGGCSSLKNIEIPESLAKIGYWIFADCTSLESVTLPETLEFVGTGSFAGCSALKEINIPVSAQYISNQAFVNCDNLEKITVNNPDCAV